MRIITVKELDSEKFLFIHELQTQINLKSERKYRIVNLHTMIRNGYIPDKIGGNKIETALFRGNTVYKLVDEKNTFLKRGRKIIDQTQL